MDPAPPSSPPALLTLPVAGTTALSLLALKGAQPGSPSRQHPTPCPTTCRAIDEDVLQHGGFDYGLTTLISGVESSGTSLIVIEAVISHLLADPAQLVAVIDTTGAGGVGDVRRLVRCLRRRLEGLVSSQGEKEKRVIEVLERVRVMRVFDFEGLVEAIGEVREGLEGGCSAALGGEERRRGGEMGVEEVGDSEGESDEGDMGGNVEMAGVEYVGGPGRKVGMVVVDHLTNVTTAMFSRYGQSEGLSLLHTFLPSLSLLTSHHKLLTVVVNGVVNTSYKSFYGNNRAMDEDSVRSVFSSVGVKPALGKGVVGWADVNVMVSKVVKRRRDAERAFGGDEGGGKTGWEEVAVAECLTDRRGNRAGRWGCFEMVDERIRAARL